MIRIDNKLNKNKSIRNDHVSEPNEVGSPKSDVDGRFKEGKKRNYKELEKNLKKKNSLEGLLKKKKKDLDGSINMKLQPCTSKHFKDKIKSVAINLKDFQRDKTKIKKIKKENRRKFFENNLKDENVKQEDSSEDSNDWEEVKDTSSCYTQKHKISDVQFTIKSGKIKDDDEKMNEEVRCAINRSKYHKQRFKHQTHILCLLTHGRFLNNFLSNDPLIQAILMSLVPLKFFDNKESFWTVESIVSLMHWFQSKFSCLAILNYYKHQSLEQWKLSLITQINNRKIDTGLDMTIVFSSMMRSLGLKVRLIHSFLPLPLNPPDLLKKNINVKKALDQNSQSKEKQDENEGKESGNKSKQRMRFRWWTEVFLPSEFKWLYVNCFSNKVGGLADVQSNIKRPFLYILAYNNDNSIKDLTSKYDERWLESTRKKREDTEDWWLLMSSRFKTNSPTEELKEDAFIAESLKKKLFPQNFTAYKRHSLYVLEKDLLKYEYIKPSATVLTWFKGLPVFSRQEVHIVHSREKWQIKGMRVMDGEEPVKVVKTNKKQSKQQLDTSQVLPLFGEWQTQIYTSPPVVRGIIPKNKFGNVEVFQQWMIPEGAVYLEESMPGLGKLASRLGLDVAPAMKGWEFYKNIAAPVLSGWVVCEKDKDLLISAWHEEQQEIEKKLRQKKEKKTIRNWELLARGLLLREKVMRKFGFSSDD